MIKEEVISKQAVKVRLAEIINEMEQIFAGIRERHVDDSVCGLCEYDGDHGIDGFANECPGFERDDCFKLKDKYRKEWESLEGLPSVTPQPKTGRCEGELKPCPFCGGKATYDTNGNAYWVICLGCGARSRITCFDGDKGRRIVSEAWNRRV